MTDWLTQFLLACLFVPLIAYAVSTGTVSIMTTLWGTHCSAIGAQHLEALVTFALIRSHTVPVGALWIADGSAGSNRGELKAFVTLTLARSHALSVLTRWILTDWGADPGLGLFVAVVALTLVGSDTGPVLTTVAGRGTVSLA